LVTKHNPNADKEVGELLMKRISFLLLAGALSAIGSAQVVFQDNFSSASQLDYYGVDRAPAATWETTTFAGQTVAHIGLAQNATTPYNDPFYNFQGYVRYANTAQTTGFAAPAIATLSVDLYVPTAWNGATTKRGGDLWARIDDTTQTVGNDAYPTLGVYNYGDGAGAQVSIFTPYDGNIFDFNATALAGFGTAINFDGWNNLKMVYKGTSGVDFFFNNTLIKTDNDPGYANTVSLDASFLQAWRPSSFITNPDLYDVYFDNHSLSVAPVPEPTTMLACGVGVAALLRRRRKA
jgi:hypothetical protein